MLFTSAYFSLFVQFIVGIFNLYGLSIDVPKDKMIFSDILKIEFFVQTIEFIFYVWMAINFELIKNITPYRYFDWIITTPTMLLTFIVFLSNKDNANLKEFLIKNKSFIIEIFILNLIMLLFGLAGELNYIDYRTGIILGFIPFIYYFKMIYDKFLTKDKETFNLETNYAEINSTDNNKMKVYWFFLIVWSIYGIVAFLPYEEKNTAYNILDLFAKNFFSVFLVIILNVIMMLFGLAGELNYMDYNTAIIIGFIPFVYYFKMINDKYLYNNTEKDKVKLYWFFFIIWTLYGVAAFLPYEQKNTAYNILDLFSKNLFSVYLVLIILNLKKNSK
jgi:hypothetical protein